MILAILRPRAEQGRWPAGTLLLGRIFNPWDIAAYLLGVVLALQLHQALGRPNVR